MDAPMQVLDVLVVEDEPNNREMVEVILLSEGHCVTSCVNGAEAVDLRFNQGKHFDIVLMDILMPIMDGLEATRRIRSSTESRDTPIICLSARASGRYEQAGNAAGASFYLSKPFKRLELLNAISETLRSAGRLATDESITLLR